MMGAFQDNAFSIPVSTTREPIYKVIKTSHGYQCVLPPFCTSRHFVRRAGLYSIGRRPRHLNPLTSSRPRTRPPHTASSWSRIGSSFAAVCNTGALSFSRSRRRRRCRRRPGRDLASAGTGPPALTSAPPDAASHQDTRLARQAVTSADSAGQGAQARRPDRTQRPGNLLAWLLLIGLRQVCRVARLSSLFSWTGRSCSSA